MAQSFPESYTTYHLPDIRLAHHPASSPTVTPIIIIFLDRPAHHHSYTQSMGASLVAAYDMLSSDPRVRAIVLAASPASPASPASTAPPHRFFCAGMQLGPDVSGIHFGSETDKSSTALSYRDSGGAVALAMHRCRKPIVAAVQGLAVGIGITMTLPATARVASRAATRVGFVFARRGLCMEACSSFFLPRLVGPARAVQLVASAPGPVLPADHALLAGVFGDVVETAEEVLPAALALAEEMAARVSLAALRLMRDMVYRGPGSPEEAHLLESRLFYALSRPGTDSEEGIRSFLDKREPRFGGTVEGLGLEGVYPWWKEVDVGPKGGFKGKL